MYKRPAIILSTLFIAAFAIIALLAFISKNIHEKKNGFNRQLLNITLQSKNRLTFPMFLNRLIGEQSGKLYFQGITPYEIYETGLNLDSVHIIKLAIPPAPKLQTGFRMFLNGRQLYITFRNLPGVIVYDLDTQTAQEHVIDYPFSKEFLIAKDRFILRAKTPASNDHLFTKLDLQNKTARQEDQFTEKIGKGGFPTDGILYFDSTAHLACYTFFYQNGFICIDTNLNLTNRAHTIDTITKRDITVAEVSGALTMKQPPPVVNSIGSVYKGYLYLQSMLKADNEYELDFNEHSIVDIYHISTGSYKGSFYLPTYNGKKATFFNVIGRTLYAAYGKTTLMYELDGLRAQIE